MGGTSAGTRTSRRGKKNSGGGSGGGDGDGVREGGGEEPDVEDDICPGCHTGAGGQWLRCDRCASWWHQECGGGELELRTMKVTDCGSAVFASLSLPPRKPIRVRSIP